MTEINTYMIYQVKLLYKNLRINSKKHQNFRNKRAFFTCLILEQTIFLDDFKNIKRLELTTFLV